MSNPVIFIVNVFIDVAIFVVLPNHNVAIILVICDDLVESSVRPLQCNQLRVATTKEKHEENSGQEYGYI
jgi:hypothetical protein